MTCSPDPGVASIQGTLALDFGRRVRSTRGPDLRLVQGDRLELEGFAHRFASALVEVMGGDRGPSQLLRWTSESVHADLSRRVALLHRTTPNDRRVRRLRSQVQSIHLYCPSPSAAEVSIHVRRGQRSRAIAARLELVEGRWTCVASSSADAVPISRRRGWSCRWVHRRVHRGTSCTSCPSRRGRARCDRPRRTRRRRWRRSRRSPPPRPARWAPSS
jgi:hypothetical protein